MNKDKMDVSIIIINYNTTKLLINSIDSVFEKTKGIEYEIIVADNNSPDNPKNILNEKYRNRITFLGLSKNIGFGRANNEAAKIAKGKYLFFLNPDTILLNNAVKILSDYLDDNSHVGCCGGNLVDKDKKPILSFFRFFTPSIFEEINYLFLKLPEKLLYGKNTLYNYTNKPLKVNYITGADLMIRKNIFDKLHGFDPDFFMYCEEAELEHRVEKDGYIIVSVPYARIIHLEGKSFSNNVERLKNLYFSREIFLKKTHNQLSIKIIHFLFFIRIKLHLFIYNLFKIKEKSFIWLEIDTIFSNILSTKNSC